MLLAMSQLLLATEPKEALIGTGKPFVVKENLDSVVQRIRLVNMGIVTVKESDDGKFCPEGNAPKLSFSKINFEPSPNKWIFTAHEINKSSNVITSFKHCAQLNVSPGAFVNGHRTQFVNFYDTDRAKRMERQEFKLF